VTGIFRFLTPLQEIYILSSEWTRAAALKKSWFSRIWIVNGVAQSLIKKPGTPKTLYQRKKKRSSGEKRVLWRTHRKSTWDLVCHCIVPKTAQETLESSLQVIFSAGIIARVPRQPTPFMWCNTQDFAWWPILQVRHPVKRFCPQLGNSWSCDSTVQIHRFPESCTR
jgi:hypothetical protein